MANLNENLVDVNVSAEDKADIIAAFDALKALLPFVIELTKEERKGKKAVQDHFIGFCNDMLQAMQDIPRCKPERVNLTKLANDTSVWDVLKSFSVNLKTLATKVSDTQLQSGHEAYQAAKLGYNTLEMLGKSGDTECMVRYEDIQQRYFGKLTGPRSKKED